MKLQPSYRSPFAKPGFYESVSRGEAAKLIQQWRRNGESIIRINLPTVIRGYRFRGHDGETAVMALRRPS